MTNEVNQVISFLLSACQEKDSRLQQQAALIQSLQKQIEANKPADKSTEVKGTDTGVAGN